MATYSPIQQQILSLWGSYGDWNQGGIDRAAELARLFEANGITDLSQIGLGEITRPVERGAWQGGDAGEYKTWTEDDTFRQLKYGDKTLGFLGDVNRDNSLAKIGAEDVLGKAGMRTGDLLGWSATGKGNVSYVMDKDPKTGQLFVRPEWGSSSDMDDVRDIAKGIAAVLAIGYGLPPGFGEAGATAGAAAVNSAGLTAAEAAALYGGGTAAEIAAIGGGELLGAGAAGAAAGAAVEPAIGEAVSSAVADAGAAGGTGATAGGGGYLGTSLSNAIAGMTPAAMEAAMGAAGYGFNAAAAAAAASGSLPWNILANGAGAAAGGSFWNAAKGAWTAAKNLLSTPTAGDWMRFGGPVLGAAIGAYSLDKATDAQKDSIEQSNALLKEMYDQNVARNQPFVIGGVQGFYNLLDKLGLSGNTGAQGYGSLNRTTSPQDVLNTPGYQFGMNQGLKAQQQKLNAQGMSYSGPAIKAATRYGTDYATTKFNDAFNRDESSKMNEFNRLMGVTSVGQNAANFTANTGTQYANQVSSNLQQAGNASAANYMGMGNLLSGAIQQGISSYQNKPYEDAYLAYLRSIGAAPGG